MHTFRAIPRDVRERATRWVAVPVLLLSAAPSISAQGWADGATQLLLPQRGAFSARVSGRPAQPIRIESVVVRARIVGRAATSDLEITVRNAGGSREQAVLLLAVPDEAVVSGFDFVGRAVEPTARVLPREEARKLYDDIVRRQLDPALLEFAGHALLRSSVFPVEPNATQKIRLTLEHLCPVDASRVDYVLPRSEALGVGVPWDIEVKVDGRQPIATLWSPSHEIDWAPKSSTRAHVRLESNDRLKSGPFRLSVVRRSESSAGLSSSLFAHPDPRLAGKGGTFLLLAQMPGLDDTSRAALRREVTLVLDTSGSMAGEKLDQAKAAALQIVEGLEDGEAFDLVDYSTRVARFATRPVVKSTETVRQFRQYLGRLKARGGTNLCDALVEAVRPKPTPGALPIVLFLTDGLPTVGTTNEVAIRELVATSNTHKRRIFTFGVGTDVNAPLLDRLAEHSRGKPTYVLPSQDVELIVTDVFEDLYGPVLTDARLDVLDANGDPAPRRVRDLMPRELPDLFEGDQIVLAGRYFGHEPLRFRLAAQYLGRPRVFEMAFDLDRASPSNAFVSRLWANRRIGELVDAVRQHAVASGEELNVFSNPRMRELRDEIVRLSTSYGILTEYTSFFADEGTALNDLAALQAQCGYNLQNRAVQTRWGVGALNQSANLMTQKAATTLNPANRYLNAAMEAVEFQNVVQLCDKAFFQRGNRWIDGELLVKQEKEVGVPEQVIRRGTEEFRRLLQRLAGQNRSGVLTLHGDLLIELDGRRVLVK